MTNVTYVTYIMMVTCVTDITNVTYVSLNLFLRWMETSLVNNVNKVLDFGSRKAHSALFSLKPAVSKI